MLITALGDRALRVQIGEKIDEATLARVRAACAAIEGAALPGVSELVPAYTTVTVHYDPAAVAAAGASPDDLAGWLGLQIEQALAKAEKVKLPKARRIEIAVCYGGEFGPDLARVAQQAKLSPEEVVRRHAKADYSVAMVGFAPGFPYLIGLPEELATPRHAKPRTLVPAGSVGIAGAQTGIYSLATPGGWNLIGRAAVRLFDPLADPPATLQAGDRVKFREVDRGEWEKLKANG